jgi:peptidoglycan hydrolase-like protein with peptidoglycan-binding domain
MQNEIIRLYSDWFPVLSLNCNPTSNPDVKFLQARLNKCLPYIIPIDGIFDHYTEGAVIDLQNIYQLEANGIVNYQVWQALGVHLVVDPLSNRHTF